jgi:hypothetical protein
MKSSLIFASVAGLAYPIGFVMILTGMPPFAWLLIMPAGAALLVAETKRTA